MSDGVWVSQVLRDSTLVKGFDSDKSLEDYQLSGDTARRNYAGEPLPQERFPQEMYGKYPDKKYGRQPDIFRAGGGFTVSSEFADVLRSVNLGRSALYPVKLFQHDQTTPVEGEYFSLNIGDTLQAFTAEESCDVRKPYPNVDLWKLPLKPKDGDIAVRETALRGPDLWMDPHFRDGIFLSDRLVQALKAAKLTRRLGLTKARVLRDN